MWSFNVIPSVVVIFVIITGVRALSISNYHAPCNRNAKGVRVVFASTKSVRLTLDLFMNKSPNEDLFNDLNSNERNEREEDNTLYTIRTVPARDNPQGYLSPDFNSVGDGKQIRVLVYIVLALLPCIFLVPFFLSRDFVPPMDIP